MKASDKPLALSNKQVAPTSAKSLYNYIFDSEDPELVANSLPAQSLYTIIKERGFNSSIEILEIASIPAYQTFLDLDLWDKDNFNEDNIWEWLSLSEEEDPLKLLQKFLKCVDLKIIAWMIAKYVQIQIFEHGSENPPGPAWFTPDKGYTWIFVNIEDPDRHFSMNRLLALIFETKTDLFYQILSIPSVSTVTLLEEEAFQDRTKRLSAEGVPEFEFYQQINSSLFPYQAKEILSNAALNSVKTFDTPVVEPIISYASARKIHPLDQVLQDSSDTEANLAEMTLILNASLQFYNVPFYDNDLVKAHAKKVKGAINIGLEKAALFELGSYNDCANVLGLTKLYQLGLFELRALAKPAKSATIDEIKGYQSDPAAFSIIAHLREEFPSAPEFLNENGEIQYIDKNQISTDTRPIEHLNEIAMLTKLTEQIFNGQGISK